MQFKSIVKFFRGLFQFSLSIFLVSIILAKFPEPRHLPGSIVLCVALALCAFWPIILYTKTGDLRGLVLLTEDFQDQNNAHAADIAQTARRFCYPTLLCAWIGSIYLPLDEETKLQVWPFPCLIGGLVGFFIGVVMSLVAHFTRQGLPRHGIISKRSDAENE